MVQFDHPVFGRRVPAATLLIFLCFTSLFIRLWYLQVLKGADFRYLSENNRTRAIRTAPPRGNLWDREGRALALNRAAFNVALIPEDVHEIKQTLDDLAKIIGRDPTAILASYQGQRSTRPFEPKVVIEDITHEELARVKAQLYRLPGVIVQIAPTRSYPNNGLAAQVLGYAREINKVQLDERKALGYVSGDVIGQSGLEREWEEKLRGTAGKELIEVDARGSRKRELGIVESRAGQDLHLTIDLDLQRTAEEALAGRRGAVVVLDPNNGDVLTMASGPTFDANIFTGQMLASEWERVSGDPNRPLRNRAISESYPAGSTFKLVMSVAGLAEHKISTQSVMNCPGYFMFAGRPFKCHKKSGHGGVNLLSALTLSCNAFYYQLGNMLGIQSISYWGYELGLGAPTGIALPGEEAGVMPSEEWKHKRFGQKWYPGETISVSIGQGYVSVTPLQMATMVSAIANGGTVYTPRLVSKVVNNSGAVVEDFGPKITRTLKIDPQILGQVREVAAGVVNDKRGTGTKAALPGIIVAGKTGTAQVAALEKSGPGTTLNDHAWFVAFAPLEKPMIALAIIVENGGHGGTASAPISRQVMETFFKKKGILVDTPLLEVKPTESEVDEGIPDDPSVSDMTPAESNRSENIESESVVTGGVN